MNNLVLPILKWRTVLGPVQVVPYNQKEKAGPIRKSNPGPPAPEAGIMPLDQLDELIIEIKDSIYNKLLNNQKCLKPQQHQTTSTELP